MPVKLWVCIDPKDLNKAIVRPKYPMPTLEKILPTLAKVKYLQYGVTADEL